MMFSPPESSDHAFYYSYTSILELGRASARLSSLSVPDVPGPARLETPETLVRDPALPTVGAAKFELKWTERNFLVAPKKEEAYFRRKAAGRGPTRVHQVDPIFRPSGNLALPHHGCVVLVLVRRSMRTTAGWVNAFVAWIDQTLTLTDSG